MHNERKPLPPVSQNLRWIIFACAAGVIAIRGLMIVAWLIMGDGTQALLGTRTKFSSGCSLGACAVALILQNFRAATTTGTAAKRENLQKISAALSVVAITVCVVMLLEYAFNINLGLDESTRLTGAGATIGLLGRMAPNAALSVGALALSLLILDASERATRIAQRLAIVSGVIGIGALLGYIFSARRLYQISSVVGISPYTSVCILLLAAGVLMSRPRAGIMRILLSPTPSGRFARRMILAALIGPPIIGWIGITCAQQGYFSIATSTALVAAATILLFLTLLGRSTEAMSAAEAAMNETAMQFQTMANSIPQMAWMGDADGNLIWYNQRWYDYTGTTFQEMEGWGWQKVHHADFLPATITRWKAAIATGQPWEDVFQLRARSGEFRWFLSRALPIRGENGAILRWFGTNTDIDDQRRSERALRSSEQRYATLISALPQLVWTSLAQGDVNYLSPQWVAYTGIPESEQLGLNWLKRAIHPDDRDRTLTHWMGAVAGHHPYDLEYRIRRFDGAYRWFKTRGTMLTDENGQVTNWFGTCTDIHDQKVVAEELNEAKLSAERASQAKTQFLANMSHEIRTPIGAIMGFTDLLKNPTNSASERLNYMTIVERNSQQLLRLIDDILDLSKVEAGRIDLENAAFSFPEFLSTFSSVMSLRAAEKSITYNLKLLTPIPDRIETDQLRLRQILSNIVGNALKFTDRGTVDLIVTYTAPNIEFAVQDTGPGISSEQSARLFRAFSQADPSMTRKFGGTGLGLVLSKKLSQALGGDLFLRESEVNRGSTFVARICPTVADDVPLVGTERLTLPIDSLARPSERNGRLENLRILLVEDSPDNQNLITTYLRRTGATVEIANNGIEGLSAALTQTPDVVLMDIQMPKMDGHEATRRLRQSGFNKPIIALTAHAMREERDRCIESGFTDYLTKPVQRPLLIEVLERFAATLALESAKTEI